VQAQPADGLEQSGASEPPPLDELPPPPVVAGFILVPVVALFEPPVPTMFTTAPPAHVIDPAIKESEKRATALDKNRIAASPVEASEIRAILPDVELGGEMVSAEIPTELRSQAHAGQERYVSCRRT
jgi:hypothetical protein